MPTLYAEIDINAPQSVVWDALIRKDQWRYWNTFLYDCDPGLTLARGNEIFLSMQRLEGDEETEFQPVITMMRSPYLMKWVSTIPGLRSEHVFELQETVPGRTRYIHRETFSGILSKVFLPFIRQDERQGLRRMAQQLKLHVENTVLGSSTDRRYPSPNQGYSSRPYEPPRGSRRPYSEPPQERFRPRPYDDRGYGDRPDPRRDDYGHDDYGRDDYRRNDYPGDYDDRSRRR